jgi:glycosyltransferase involved in cell wall biosynthesis
MACGAVCVLNDLPVLREITAGHAIFVDYRDPDSVAAALSTALFDNNVRRRLRHLGFQRAAAFDFDRLATERIAAISRIPRPHPQTGPAARQPL